MDVVQELQASPYNHNLAEKKLVGFCWIMSWEILNLNQNMVTMLDVCYVSLDGIKFHLTGLYTVVAFLVKWKCWKKCLHVKKIGKQYPILRDDHLIISLLFIQWKSLTYSITSPIKLWNCQIHLVFLVFEQYVEKK